MLALSGWIEADVAALFVEQLAGLSSLDAPLSLDLRQARLDDPRIAAMLAEGIRQTAQRIGAVEVIGAPTALRKALEGGGDRRVRISLE
jgi:ABC-type transporter Mla MlaB component